MQEESIPTESVESETVPEQAPTGPLPGVRRTTAVLTACAVLALPVGYLLLHHSTVNAGTPAPGSVPPAQSIAMLEAQVRAQPTAANRINLSLAYINGGEAARAKRTTQHSAAARFLRPTQKKSARSWIWRSRPARRAVRSAWPSTTD